MLWASASFQNPLDNQTSRPGEAALLNASTWPIAGATLALPPRLPDGREVHSAGPGAWLTGLRTMARAGFVDVDLTDSWIRPSDLNASQLTELSQAAAAAGVRLRSMSVIRRSVIDKRDGLDHLAYSHRALEAAAALGMGVVSFGLHQALSPAQQKALWFWTEPGHKDPDDPAIWELVVNRLSQLGQHASSIGLVISLEMVEDTYLGTADSAVALVSAINSPHVGLNPDVGNLIRLHRPVEDWREVLAKTLPFTNYWHVKNYQRDEDLAKGLYVAMPAHLDAGIINYREALEMALAAGFQGVITAEAYGGDGLTISARAHDYLRAQVLPLEANYQTGTSQVIQQIEPKTGGAQCI